MTEDQGGYGEVECRLIRCYKGHLQACVRENPDRRLGELGNSATMNVTKVSSDSWASGAAYEAYMGRWSRALAPTFVDWLRPAHGAHWLEVGCGTGALTAVICQQCEPASLVACDPAEPFVLHAQSNVSDARASFVLAGADALPTREGGFDAIVSGLVLNFLPHPARAVVSMRDRLRAGGVVAAYVWDYASGLEFLRYFWDEAVALDPDAAALDEGARFPICNAPALAALFRAAGFTQVQTTALDIATDFLNFDYYWAGFLAGTGPAPSYVASLDPTQYESLRQRVQQRMPIESDGQLRLRGRAWAVAGRGKAEG